MAKHQGGIGMADDPDKDGRITFKTVITWVLTVGTVGVGIWQFAIQHAQSNRVPFLTKQLELGFQAADAAARLATETDPAEWEKARTTFWRLYWGPLSVVEDREVEAAMVTFGKLIPQGPVPDLPLQALQRPSLDLAHTVRDLILASWNVDLPPLQGRTP
jgi:hypothetical protein